MHEFSLLADLLRKIERSARDAGPGRVVRVRVWLGALSHISARHFAEHFAAGSRGTLAEGAELEIEESTDLGHPQAQQVLLRSLDVR